MKLWARKRIPRIEFRARLEGCEVFSALGISIVFYGCIYGTATMIVSCHVGIGREVRSVYIQGKISKYPFLLGMREKLPCKE